MTVCPRCGVRLADDATHCPLCRRLADRVEAPALVETSGFDGTQEARYPAEPFDIEDFERLPPPYRARLAMELFAVCSTIAGAVVIAVDLVGDARVGWSLYPVASLAYLLATVLSFGMLRKRPVAGIAGQASAIVLFLAALDELTGGRPWFWPGGVAIVAAVEVPVITVAIIIRAMKKKGINLIAVILAAIAAACIGIELAIEYGTGMAEPSLDWSLIVATASLPVAILLVYLHYRVTSQSSLAKLFHL